MAESYKDQERRLKAQERSIHAWQRQLTTDRAGAFVVVDKVMAQLASLKLYHPTELARFYAQMINGAAHPGDFGINDERGGPKRA